MKGRPQDYMQVGIVHHSAYPGIYDHPASVVGTLRELCEDDYFQAIEISSVKDRESLSNAIEIVRTAEKTVFFGAQPVLLNNDLNLNALLPVERQRALDAVRDCIAEAKSWGASGVSVISGADPGEQERLIAKAMLCASLKEICEISRRMMGPPLFLEVFGGVPSGCKRLIGSTAEAAEIADKVYPFYVSFGLSADIAHLALVGETPEHVVKTASPYLRYVQISNCAVHGRNLPACDSDYVASGGAANQIEVAATTEFLKALLEAGYIGAGMRNIVSLQLRPFGNQTPQDVIINGKQVLDAAWEAL